MGIDITPYQLRHSGPSKDRSRNSRSLLEVQKRGRWKSHKSVARYEKSGRLAANFQMLPVVLQQHCLAAESHLVEVMLGQGRAPKLPSLPKAWKVNMLLTCFQVRVAWLISADSWVMRPKNGSCVEGHNSTSQNLQFWAGWSEMFSSGLFWLSCWLRLTPVFPLPETELVSSATNNTLGGFLSTFCHLLTSNKCKTGMLVSGQPFKLSNGWMRFASRGC